MCVLSRAYFRKAHHGSQCDIPLVPSHDIRILSQDEADVGDEEALRTYYHSSLWRLERPCSLLEREVDWKEAYPAKNQKIWTYQSSVRQKGGSTTYSLLV